MTEQPKLLQEELCAFFLYLKYSGPTESTKPLVYSWVFKQPQNTPLVL